MARYKHYDYGQMKMLPINFERQILSGTFEHTLNRLAQWLFYRPVRRRRKKERTRH
jgi:hypothetical protein